MNHSPSPEGSVADSSIPARIASGLAWLGGAVSAVLILLSLVLISYAVFQRYVLGTPLRWGDEIIGYLVVAMVMAGAAEALRRGDHISIDLLAERAGPRSANLLALWSDASVFAFAAIIAWSAWEAITFAYSFGSYSAGYLQVATWIPKLPVLGGGLLLALVSLTRFLQRLGRGATR